MALLERLAILISADASGALSEMKKVADSAEKDLGKAGAAGSTLSGQMTKVGAAMVGVGVGMLAVGINAANTTENLGKEVIKLQRYTGATAEEASKLAYAARMSGVDVDSLGTHLGRMAKAMDTAPQKFTQLGVEVRTSDGHLRSMGDVLLDVADKFKAMGPGTETTAKAIELFGRNGASMLPFLLKGKDGIQELTNEAEKMGLVLSQDNVQAVKDHIKAQRELNAAIDGIKNQIGQEMLPILTDFTKLIAGLPGPVKDVAGPLVVVGGAIALVGGAALLAAGQIQKMVVAYGEMSVVSRTAVGALGAIGAAVTVLTVAYSVHEGAANRAAKAQAKVNDEVLAGAKAGSFNELNDIIGKTSEQLDKFATRAGKKGLIGSEFFIWDRGKAEGQYNDTKRLLDQLENYQTMTEAIAGATGKSRDEVYKWVVTQAEAGNVFEDTSVAVGVYTGKIDTNTLSAQNAKLAQEGLAESVKTANDAIRAATDPYFAVISAQQDYTKATKDYTDLVASGKGTRDELDAAFEKQVGSALKLQGSLATLGEEFLRGKTGPDKFKAALDLLRQFGIDPSTEQGQRLIEKIAGISWQAALTAGYLNDHPIGVKANDDEVAAVIRRLQTLRGLVDPTTGTVALGDIWNIQYQALGGRVGQGYASGGRPQPYIVGELGPELFIPDTAGTIVTAEKTRQMMAPQQSVGDVNVYVNSTNANPYDIGRELVWALRVTR